MNRVCEILGIKYPIVQAAMSWLTNAELCAAVSNAGGLGILGPNAGQKDMTPDCEETGERMRREIRKVKALTDKPFGVALMGSNSQLLSEFTKKIMDVAIEEKVPVALINSWGTEDGYGIDDGLVEPLKAAGMKMIVRSWKPSIKDAQLVEEQGGDIYVATGFDEGGTLPPQATGSFSLIPHIVDAIKIPVLLAGGVNDVRGVNAAFALGAEGVYCGTRMLATTESPVHPMVKQMMVDMTCEDLEFFRCQPAYYRSLPTELSAKLVQNDAVLNLAEVTAQNDALMRGTSGLRSAMLDGDLKNGYISTNTAISVIHSIQPAAEVIEDMMAGFRKGSFDIK